MGIGLKKFGLWDRLSALSAGESFSVRRLILNSGANSFAIFSQFVIQILSVPLLVAAFGLERYGIWLMLSTVPTYLVLSDLGLVTAATNDMAIAHTANDHSRIQRVFQTVSAAVIVLFAVVTISVALIVFITSRIEGFWSSSFEPHILVIPLLTAYAAACMISLLPVSAIKASGHFARGTLIYDICTGMEAFLIVGVAIWSRDLVITAMAPLIFRSCAMPFIYLQMRKLVPNVRFGVDGISIVEAKRLLPPAIAAVSIMIGLSLSLQGTALIIGALLGPIAVAMFVPIRTASRMPILIAGVASRAIVPEISAARGRGDGPSEQRLWKLNTILMQLVLVPAAIVFAVFGVPMITFWTGGEIVAPFSLIFVMALMISVHGYWYLNTSLLAASHEHVVIGKFVVVISAAGLGVAAVLISNFGITGAAASLLLVDTVLALTVATYLRRFR
jgi:O-antigen/teichoic acid export membrane protein